MNTSELLTPEQIIEADNLAKKAKDFLQSKTAIHYYAQRIHDGVGNHPEAFRAGLTSLRQDSQRFLD